jgi:hypothetical protein
MADSLDGGVVNGVRDRRNRSDTADLANTLRTECIEPIVGLDEPDLKGGDVRVHSDGVIGEMLMRKPP